MPPARLFARQHTLCLHCWAAAPAPPPQVEKVKERCLPDALNYPMLEVGAWWQGDLGQQCGNGRLLEGAGRALSHASGRVVSRCAAAVLGMLTNAATLIISSL